MLSFLENKYSYVYHWLPPTSHESCVLDKGAVQSTCITFGMSSKTNFNALSSGVDIIMFSRLLGQLLLLFSIF